MDAASAVMSRSRRAVSVWLLLVCVWCAAVGVRASHFAYGTISWEYAPTPATPNHYLLNFESAWRRSYVTWSPSYPSTGQTFSGYDIGDLVVSQTVPAGPCCANPPLPYWDGCWSRNRALPGSGCGVWTRSLTPINVLVKVTYPDDWLSGQTSDLSFDPPSPNNQRLTIVYTMCCRINSLVYSGGSGARVSSDVVPNHQYSPRSTSFPRQYLIKGQPASWAVPSIHPQGWPMTYSIATTGESQLWYDRPSTASSSYGAFSLDGTTGFITWTPTTLGLYSIQFKIHAKNPSNPGAGEAFVVLDTIFQIITECTQATVGCFHPPVFDPALPATATFYQGSSGTFVLTARSDDNNQVDILTSPLPSGASITYVSIASGTNSAGHACKWTTYQVLWTPSLTSTPATVCFTARDPITGSSSAGSGCVNFVFGQGSILYLSGLMRDFHKSASYPSYLTDFNRPEAQVDVGGNFVNPTLLPSGKPAFQGSATSTNAANFAKWFTDDPAYNMAQVYDVVLNNATTGRSNLFRWDSGSTWWPLDNQLFGNEADAHNRYFTLEIHTYITYTGGESLLFESSNDLWVFVDKRLPSGWNMAGVVANQPQSNVINLDQHLNPNTDTQKTFQVDIFYAHRSGTGAAQLKLSLLSATLCNSIDSGLVVVHPTASETNQVTLIGAAQLLGPTSTSVRLMPAGMPSNTGAVWWTVGSPVTPAIANAYKVSHGFEATFSFTWGGFTEGFAFVLQFDNPSALGGSGGQLGYGGLAGIKNSIAVEFDGVATSNLGDPSWQHISIHSRWTDSNDANELSRIAGSVFSGQAYNFNFANGTTHMVRIQYIPGVDDGQGGPQLGWIRVYIGTEPWGIQVVPVTSAQVDGRVLDQMWHGAAYAGFTTSTSDSMFNSIVVSDFQLKVVPASALKSFGSVLPQQMTAGQVGSMVVRLKDVCGNVILTGNDCPLITASVTHPNAPTQTLTCCTTPTCGAGSIEDNLDGTYTLRYNPTYANDPSSQYKINALYANAGETPAAISGSPFRFTVIPGSTSAANSRYSVSYDFPATGNPKAGATGVGSTGTVLITAKDVYGNLQTANTDPFIVTFSPDITATGTLGDTLKTGASTYTTTFGSTLAKSYQLDVTLNSAKVVGTPISVVFEAGKASAVQSTASGTGLVSAVVTDSGSTSGSFTLNLYDSSPAPNKNQITQMKAEDSTCLLESDGCMLIPTTTVPAGFDNGGVSTSPTPVNVPLICAWSGTSLTCSYSVQIAYTYNVKLIINGVAMAPLLSTAVSVTAGDVSAANCVAEMPTDARAGMQSTIRLQARDKFNNNLPSIMTGAFALEPTSNPATPPAIVGAPVFTSFGLYTVAFTPTIAGDDSYSIVVTAGGVALPTTYKVSVAPGDVAEQSSAGGIATTVTASLTPNTFTITSRDAYNNLRKQGGWGNQSYVVTLSNDATTQTITGSVRDSSTETFTAEYIVTVAGAYALTTVVQSTSIALLSGGSTSITVNPAATSSANCAVTGQGLAGAVLDDTVSISIIAKDAFNNVQLDSVNDQFKVVIADTNPTIDVTFTRDTTTAPYIYTASYTVPQPITGKTYTVQVQREVSGSFETFGTYTAVASNDADKLYVTLSGGGATAGTNGVPNTFVVVERDGISGEPVTVADSIPTVTICSAISCTPSNSIPTSVTTLSTASWTVTYTPVLKFPSGNPNFNITVQRGSITSSAPALLPQNGQIITASPYPLVLSAGTVSPGKCVITTPSTWKLVAGSVVTFTIDMFDASGNPINTALSGAVTATLVSLVTFIPPIADITLTGVHTGGNTYTFTSTASQFQRASTYSMTISHGTDQLGGAARQLLITPDVPAAAQCDVQPTAATGLPTDNILFSALVAGSQASFAIIVRDQFRNLIVDDYLPASHPITDYLAISLTEGTTSNPAVIGTPVYSGGNGAYTVSITAFKANTGATSTWPLSVTVSGTAVTRTPQVHVVADVISDKSTYTLSSPTVIAGAAISFTLDAKDQYSNPWQAGGLDVTVKDAQGRPIVGAATATPVTNQLGTFDIVLPTLYTRLVNKFQFFILRNGKEFLRNATGGFDQPIVQVLPGPPAAANTVVPVRLLPVQAGDTVTISLGLRDAYGNIVDDLSHADLVTLMNPSSPYTFPINTGEVCDNDDTQLYPPDGFTPLTITVAGENVNVSFISTRVGKFVVNITMDGEMLSCNSLTRMAIDIKPGPAVAANSRVVGLRNVTAGEPINLVITVFDEFYNQVNVGGDVVEVGQPYTGTIPPAMQGYITSDQTQWLQPQAGNVVLYDPAYLRYTISVTASKAGSRQVVVTLNGLLIPTYINNGSSPTEGQLVASIPPVIYVSPSGPATWSLVKPSSSIRAGIPFTVTLQVQDLFSNPITQLNQQYNYSYDIQGQNAALTDYVFTGTLKFLAGGQYQWTATSVYSNRTFLSVQLVQLTNPTCAGIDATRPIQCANKQCVNSTSACAESVKKNAEIMVLPATCGAADASKPFRCPEGDPNGPCVADWTGCATLAVPGVVCTGTKNVKCAVDDSCVASADMCPCGGGLMRCASGVCVKNNNTDCHPVAACPRGQVACKNWKNQATGQCRTTLAECPSPRVCTPGYLACPDGLSCARSLAECAPINTDPCPQGQFHCASGRCTQNAQDCATPKTCPAGETLCLSDGSCASDFSKCADQYQCYAPTPKRCPDGSCRGANDLCPTVVTCPQGWVLCENGQCASSVESCLMPRECPVTKVRCPSGSCADNILLCESQQTCPDGTVQCADRSCQSSVAFCVNPRVCPAGSFVCPDGSCVGTSNACPSTISCPPTTPNLCADGVSCVADIKSCVAPAACPIQNSMRCPDGSCRGSLLDCPSRSSCPSDTPVRCADGMCVLSSQQCLTVPTCPASAPIRCPGGECVASSALCPTHVTCPLGSTLCADGSCRESCTVCVTGGNGVSNCALVKQTACEAGLLRCPVATTGSYCVSSLSQCPLAFICPAATPVRCLDTSCAVSSSSCPPLPSSPPESNKRPCPDGSWGTDASKCNTPASCPPNMPYKCWDETCRAVPSDCSVPKSCPTLEKPYRCPNGACAPSPYDISCLVTQSARPCNRTTTAVKCPSSYECVTDVSQCPAATASSQETISDTKAQAAACPPLWARCRDGTCKMSASSCDKVLCPANLPYLCASGVCAEKPSTCPDPITGCYAPKVGCYSTGACVDDVNDLSQCPLPDSDCFVRCGDGLCVSDIRNYDAICANHQCALRCADRTCGLEKPVANITASTPGNLCVLGGSQTALRNVCPPSRPFRCPDGLCALSELNCAVTISNSECPAATPVACASGVCVADATQCPLIYPCAANEMRCGDGSCQVRQPSDKGNECKAWGIGNTCPWMTNPPQDIAGNPIPTRRYRCPNGLCSLNGDASGCVDLQTGCPIGPDVNRHLDTKCPNGACIVGPRFSGFNNLTDACDAVSATDANGCSGGLAKCTSSGLCVANTTTDCPNTVGCLPATPFRCTGPNQDGKCVADLSTCEEKQPGCVTCADGSCVTDATQCKMRNGCPANKPYLCVNGECREFPSSALQRGAPLSQVCPPTLTCPASQFMCFDGSCAVVASLCPPADPSSTAAGGIVNGRCPAAVPILCDNGACVGNVKSCQQSSSPGTTTGTGVLGTVLQQNAQQSAVTTVTVSTPNTGVAILPIPFGLCSDDKPLECFDGSCVTDYAACQSHAVAIRGGPCPAGTIACPSGECTPDPKGDQSGLSACRVIPACGDKRPRCPDGSCAPVGGSCASAPAMPACTDIVLSPSWKPVPTQRCQDGVCRYQCPMYDGCPMQATPYQCPNRECAASADQCSTAELGKAFDFNAELPWLIPPLQPVNLRRLLGLPAYSTPAAAAAAVMPAVSGRELAASDPATAGWCYSNCLAQVKASDYTTLLDPTVNQRLVVATDAAFRDLAWLEVSAGAFNYRDGHSLSTDPRVSVTISPVSDSQVRGAENRVPSSRSDVTTAGFLTYVETVLSPMFAISVNESVVDGSKFNVNLTLTSFIDMNHINYVRNLQNPPAAPDYTDICLAELYRIESIGYSAWRCLYYCTSGVGDDVVVTRCPVRDATSSGDASQVSGSIGHTGIYAFVMEPVGQPPPESTLSWAQENALWIFLVLTGGVVFIFFVFYCGQRLYRYRAKYKAEAAAVKEQLEEVDDMIKMGGQAGRKDDEVVMMANPLVMQMKDMQARLDEKQLELRQEEQRQKKEATVVRHEHINELQADRDELAAQLEEMRKQLDLMNSGASQARPQAVAMAPAVTASSAQLVSGVVTSDSEYAMGGGASSMGVMPDQPAQQARTEFQAQRPRKKAKDVI